MADPLLSDLDDDGHAADTLLADMAAGWDHYQVPTDSAIVPPPPSVVGGWRTTPILNSMIADLNGVPSRAANTPSPSSPGGRSPNPSPRPGSPLEDYYDPTNATAFRMRCAARLAPIIARLNDIHSILTYDPSMSRTLDERRALQVLSSSVGRAADDLGDIGRAIGAIAGGKAGKRTDQ